MPNKLYIADWHYGHGNILAYDNRPFKSVEEMNAALVERWNTAVQKDDTVYVLGDMFWSRPQESIPVMRNLNGEKILIKGNHDKLKDNGFVRQFADIRDYAEIEDGDRHLVLCHYPIPCFKNHFRGWIHLYGHVHISFEHNMMEHDRFLMKELYGHPMNMINIGAMMPWMDYTPRTLDEILHGYEAHHGKTEE